VFTSISNLTPQLWQMYAVADNSTQVAEGNEGNNVGGPRTVDWQSSEALDYLGGGCQPAGSAGFIAAVSALLAWLALRQRARERSRVPR
jgi:hypothetical protein